MDCQRILNSVGGRGVCVIALLGCLAMPSVSWGISSAMSIESVEPKGPYLPGDEVVVKGTMKVKVTRGWGGGGLMTTRVSHQIEIHLDFKTDEKQAWPLLPDTMGAQGNLYQDRGAAWTLLSDLKNERQELKVAEGGSMHLVTEAVDVSPRKERTDPFEETATIPFEASFTVPESCYEMRLRGVLSHSVGSRWMVTHFLHSPHPLEASVRGKQMVILACMKKGYPHRLGQLMVSDTAREIEIVGRVNDRALKVGVKNAVVTGKVRGGEQVQVRTDRSGRYILQLENPKGEEGESDSGSLDFQMESELPAYRVRVEVSAPDYHPVTIERCFRYSKPLGEFRFWGATIKMGGAAIENAIVKVTVNGQSKTGTRRAYGNHQCNFPLGDYPDYKSWMPTIRLEPIERPENATGAAGDEFGWQGVYEKKVGEMIEKASPGNRKVWMLLGLANAIKKDMEDAAKGKSGSSNLKRFTKNIQRPSGEVAEAMNLLGELVTSKEPLVSKANEWDGKLKDYNEYLKKTTGKDLIGKVKGNDAFKDYWKAAAKRLAATKYAIDEA